MTQLTVWTPCTRARPEPWAALESWSRAPPCLIVCVPVRVVGITTIEVIGLLIVTSYLNYVVKLLPYH